MESIDIWKFLAGLGIFLMGLFFLEEALKNLAGSSFKRFLKKHTENRIKAVASGTILTAILQSSSIVSLIVLAFVGAGVISLRNAIGVIIGSNLGTTFTGWIVTLLGFQLNIDDFSMPFIAIGGLSLLFLKENQRWVEFGRLIMGFGLLFLGLGYMKISVETFAQNFDLTPYTNYGVFAFFLLGFFLTAIIQSSSASMVIVLSALHAQIITIEAAAGIIIGSDLGTTITVIMGSIQGTPSKKRVALSHFLFNLLTAVIALLILPLYLKFINQSSSIQDPLFGLVLFHSLFNFLGILLCLPFLGIIARFLENRFLDENLSPARFITKLSTDVPEAAITALRNEILHLVKIVFISNLMVLKINRDLFINDAPQSLPYKKIMEQSNYLKVYETIKQLEGEIIPFYLRIQNEKLEDTETAWLNQLIRATRYAVESAKSTKDIAHNIVEFERSSNDSKIALFDLLKGKLNQFYLNIYHLTYSGHKEVYFEFLIDCENENKKILDEVLGELYKQIKLKRLSEVEISTLMNVNREIFNANNYLILALKDTLLPYEKATNFELISDRKT